MIDTIYMVYKISKEIPFIIGIVTHLYFLNKNYKNYKNIKILKNIRNLKIKEY